MVEYRKAKRQVVKMFNFVDPSALEEGRKYYQIGKILKKIGRYCFYYFLFALWLALVTEYPAFLFLTEWESFGAVFSALLAMSYLGMALGLVGIPLCLIGLHFIALGKIEYNIRTYYNPYDG